MGTGRPPKGWLRGDTASIIVMSLGLALAIIGLRQYPWVETHDVLLWRLWALGFALSLTPLLIWQRTLFPWASVLPWLKWMLIVGLPPIGGMVFVGLLALLNGVLDSSRSVDHAFRVSRRIESNDYELIRADGAAGGGIARIRTREELQPGDSVTLVSKRGALGLEWVVTYRAQSSGSSSGHE